MTAHRSPLGWALLLDPGANPRMPEPQHIKGMRGQLSEVIPPGQALPHPGGHCSASQVFTCLVSSLFPFPPWEGEGGPRCCLPLEILQTDRPPWLSIRWELARWWWLMCPHGVSLGGGRGAPDWPCSPCLPGWINLSVFLCSS